MSDEKNILVIGGPDSGKTNFLGKLWLSIRDNEGKIVCDGVPTNLTYLNHIVDYYYQGHFAPRTLSDERNRITIPIKTSSNIQNKLQSNLIFPDVWGEEWNSIFTKRGWSDEWEKTISNFGGCLLFLRVDSDLVVPALDWATGAKAYSKSLRKNYDTPTQVILVDWVQFIIRASIDLNYSFVPRIAIILAAYDLVPKDQKDLGPDNYIKANFPLFWQFIHSNTKPVEIRIFGTSIASGDFQNDEQFREKFLQDPKNAGYVCFESDGEVKTNKDMTLPVLWSLGISID